MTTPAEIRTWAAGVGITVGPRGRISAAIQTKYAEANGTATAVLERPSPEPAEVPAGPRCDGKCNTCMVRWTGLNTCHCTGCHRTFVGPTAFDAHQVGGSCKDPARMKYTAGVRAGRNMFYPATRLIPAWTLTEKDTGE